MHTPAQQCRLKEPRSVSARFVCTAAAFNQLEPFCLVFYPLCLHILYTNPHLDALERMLHLNKDGEGDLTLANKSEQIIWKVLIYDHKSEPVISSVLRVNDLLRCGITVHKPITSQRLPLPDVPVIYFVEASNENMSIILSDLETEKYDSFYINFTLTINRELLEDFAKRVSLSGKGHKIKQVYDQFLDFVVTEPNLFSLDIPKTYCQFNNPTTTEDQIHALADTIADGLLASLITMENIPIIRCPQKGPAELVATQLDMKLRDYVNNFRGSSTQNVQERSVLIILDRNIDMASMFSHSWIYQCMVSDVFYLRRNRIKILKYKDNKSVAEEVKYDVDPRDFFWNKNSQLPFPDVVENADLELNNYKREAEVITNKTGSKSLNDVDPNSINDLSSMKEGVDALHDMRARKITLDMHMDVLALLLKELEARSLDKFFEIEQNCADPKVQAEFLQLLKSDSVRSNESDKLRTFLILNLMADLPASFVTDCEKVFLEKYPNMDMSSFKYIVKVKQLNNLVNNPSVNENRSTSAQSSLQNNSALFNGLSSKLYGFTEGRISEGISSLASGLKKLLPDKKNLPITNVVEAVMDPNLASSESVLVTDDYLFLDPKSRGGHTKPPKRQSYENAMVFVVGGGNNLEYHNLCEWALQPNKSPKKVVYGSTDVVTATQFLDEISELGKLDS